MTSSDRELVFVPLGGAGEIGMNLALYGYGGQWLMVDLGVSFGDDRTPGIDVIVPDIGFIAERRDQLAGLVLTHGHEDHLGAVPYLWRHLRCPIHASPFAAALVRAKLAEVGMEHKASINVVPRGGRTTVGPFEIEFIHAAHSIPEANILAIRSPAGTVVHATDWKLDPGPMLGPLTDEASLRRIGEEGVLAMMCDSTNVFVAGEAGSERKLRDSLTEIMAGRTGRVAVACFASNVARVESAAFAAAANGRETALVGRSLWQMTEAARQTGYLKETPRFLSERDVGFLPRDKVAMVATGSQGEPRSALARIAANDHPDVTLEAGDTVIFSSRVIPGNELSIGRLQNALARLDVEVITDDDAFVHVSGHPARDELARLYQWLRPKSLIPIHGEARHLHEHARFARQCQIPHALVAENGAMVRLAPGAPEIVDHVAAGRFAVDGPRLRPLDGSAIRNRRRIGFNGSAVATIVLDGQGRLAADPRLSVHGLTDIDDAADEDVMESALDAIAGAIADLPAQARRVDASVSEAVRLAVRRVLRERLRKRPVTDVHVVRI